MTTIALLVEPGATPSSVTATLDLFRIANRFQPHDPFDLTLFSSQGGAVALTESLNVDTAPLPQRLDDFGAVILPGFFAHEVPELIQTLSSQWQPTIERLRSINDTTLVAASCYGTFVLAESGLLNGREATTTWWLRADFEERYPAVRLSADKSLVDAGAFITAGAMTAHTDLSMHVLRRLGGNSLARRVGSIMLVDEARSSQLPFVALQRSFPDPLIKTAIEWMERHLAASFSAHALSDALHVSYRTLHRRFQAVTGMPPLVYLQALRVECAKEMLEETRKSVEQIANAVGYADVSSFRRLFTRSTSVTPAHYRRRFRRQEM